MAVGRPARGDRDRRGCSIGPDVSLTDTVVGADARISRTVAVEARIGARATVGPFAYLRPGTNLADEVHIGTTSRRKKASVGEGTKIPHLTYVGDATIGEHTNIGAATVFVNYDGVEKHHTVIGSHVRTGADNMFVAPVEVGDGAYTAAGSVIAQDVPPGAMGVARASSETWQAGWRESGRGRQPPKPPRERWTERKTEMSNLVMAGRKSLVLLSGGAFPNSPKRSPPTSARPSARRPVVSSRTASCSSGPTSRCAAATPS